MATASLDVDEPPKRGGGVKIPGRLNAAKIPKALEKLDFILSLVVPPEALGNKALFTNGARKFWIQTILPIRSCLEKHFSGDKEMFLAQWSYKGRFTHSMFYSEKCSGVGARCSVGLVAYMP